MNWLLLGNGRFPKQPALSLMNRNAPSRWTRPKTTLSPVPMRLPVRMNTPASAAACPTVGTNCRGGVTADATGGLSWGQMSAEDPRRDRAQQGARSRKSSEEESLKFSISIDKLDQDYSAPRAVFF